MNNEVSPQETRDNIKKRFQRLLQIITRGCPRERCENLICFNNPDKIYNITEYKEIQKEQYQDKIIELIKNKNTIYCDETYKPRPLSLQNKEIDFLFNEAFATNDFIHLINRIHDVFNSPEALNLSFMPNDNPKQNTNQYNYLLNAKALKNFLDKINCIKEEKIRNQIINEIKQGILKIMDNFIQNQKYLENFFETSDDLRIFMILLAIPFNIEFENINLFNHILTVYGRIPYYLYEDITYNWFSQYSEFDFKQLVGQVSTFLTLKLLSLKDGHKKEWEYIVPLANEIIHYLDPQIFINDVINQVIDPKEEFKFYILNLQNPQKKQFTFCDFYFLLGIVFKSQLLQEEYKFEQKIQEQRGLNQQISQLFMHGGGILNFGQVIGAMKLVFEVRRDHIIDDTLAYLMNPNLNYKKPLFVKFQNEQGMDEGGVKKEYFQLLCKELFNTQYGMFISINNNTLLWINQHSFEDNLKFELTGIILGLAIYNGINLDLKLPLVIYKKLQNEKILFEDLKEFDPEIYQNLQTLLQYEGNIEEDYSLTFNVITQYLDTSYKHDLIPNGENIPVTNQNKKQYIDSYINWLFNISIEQQFSQFKKGFFKVVTGHCITFINSFELQTLICGSQLLNIDELKSTTMYIEFNPNSNTIKYQIVNKRWFWEILYDFSQEEKKKFIQFCTGTDRAPVGGLAQIKLKIQRNGADSDKLPTAHTCFNHFLLPEYSSKEKMRTKILIAIKNSEGFGLL